MMLERFSETAHESGDGLGAAGGGGGRRGGGGGGGGGCSVGGRAAFGGVCMGGLAGSAGVIAHSPPEKLIVITYLLT